MPSGLQQRWGLEEPRSAGNGSTRQAQQFTRAFRTGMGDVDQSLQYTSAHAEREPHQALAGRKQTLMRRFQQVLTQIEPEDESAARRPIEQVIGGVGTLKSDAADLQRETQAALEAWQEKEEDYEQSIDKVAELEAWGDDNAAAFREAVGAIQEQVNEHKYRDAVASCEQMLIDLRPVYEEYQRQKAAKEEYEDQLEVLAPQLDAALQMTPTLQAAAHRETLIARQREMEEAAAEKNFVSAYSHSTDLVSFIQTYVEALESEIQAWHEREPAYIQAASQVEELEAWGTPQPSLRVALDAIQDQVEQRDYAQATAGCDPFLESLQPAYEELQRQKAAKAQYEQQIQTLQPQLDAALAMAPTLSTTEQRDALVTNQNEMETAVGDQAYEVAYNHAVDLSQTVLAYVTTLESEVQAWNDKELAFTAAVSQVGELEEWGDPQAPNFRDAVSTIQGQVAQRNLAEATTRCDRFLEAFNPAYEEYDRQQSAQTQYELHLDTLEPQLTTALALAPTQRTIEKRDALIADQRQMQTAADGRDFVLAASYAEDLSVNVRAYVEAVESEREDAEEWKNQRLSELQEIRNQLHVIRRAATEDAQDCVEKLRDTKEVFEKKELAWDSVLTTFSRRIGEEAAKEQLANFAWEVGVGVAFGLATGGIGSATRAGQVVTTFLVSLSEELAASATGPSDAFDSFQPRGPHEWERLFDSAIDSFQTYVNIIGQFQDLDESLDTQITWLGEIDSDSLGVDNKERMDAIDRIASQKAKLSNCDPNVSRHLVAPQVLAAKLEENSPRDIEREIAIEWIARMGHDELNQIDEVEDYLVELNVIKAGGDPSRNDSELGVDLGHVTDHLDEWDVHDRADQYQRLHRRGRQLVGQSGQVVDALRVTIDESTYSAEIPGHPDPGATVVVVDYLLSRPTDPYDGGNLWREPQPERSLVLKVRVSE